MLRKRYSSMSPSRIWFVFRKGKHIGLSSQTLVSLSYSWYNGLFKVSIQVWKVQGETLNFRIRTCLTWKGLLIQMWKFLCVFLHIKYEVDRICCSHNIDLSNIEKLRKLRKFLQCARTKGEFYVVFIGSLIDSPKRVCGFCDSEFHTKDLITGSNNL